MKRALGIFVLLGALVFWLLSAPKYSEINLISGDISRGKMVATAAGCASCHGADFAGGPALHSPFGSFYPPNITPFALAGWSDENLAHAIIDGVAPNGTHLFPAFPYKSYAGMKDQDLFDLIAYIRSIPVLVKPNTPHELPIYASWRRPLGVWKWLNGSKPTPDDRGGYIVETLAHCQECHSPRNALGVLQYARAFEGGLVYNANGKVRSKIPNLISGESKDWSKNELVEYLRTGFTPEFDSAGGEMVEVIKNLSDLPKSDVEAIADYLIKIRASKS